MNNTEIKVIKSILSTCMSDCSADIASIMRDTGLSANQIKGYIGDLVKKDIIVSESEKVDGVEYLNINIILMVDGIWETLSFGELGFDSADEDEILNQLLKVSA